MPVKKSICVRNHAARDGNQRTVLIGRTAQREALAIRRADLVVLDIGLPRLGGLDVQAELRSRAETRLVPIMIVSGTETREMNLGDFACVLRKPVTAEQLIGRRSRRACTIVGEHADTRRARSLLEDRARHLPRRSLPHWRASDELGSRPSLIVVVSDEQADYPLRFRFEPARPWH